MSAVAKHFNGLTVSEVAMPAGSYPAMPALNVPFGAPGIYNIDGYNFDCQAPGLYRFKLPGRNYFLNRFIGKDMAGQTDLYALMSAVSWNTVYGSAHEVSADPVHMTDAQCQAVSIAGHYCKWRWRCGYVARFLLWLLPQYGVQVRRVQLSTLQAPNGYSDGHVAVETYTGGKWRFWDVSSGLYFTDETGDHLSAAEVLAVFQAGGTPEVVRLDAAGRFSSDSPAYFDLSLWNDTEIAPGDGLMNWFRRVFQTVSYT